MCPSSGAADRSGHDASMPPAAPGDRDPVDATTERRRAVEAHAAELAVLAFADSRLLAMQRLDARTLIVGRAGDCALRLPDPQVSRRHLSIAREGAALIVRDLGSANGIRVGGRRVQHARLREGDGIALGDSLLRVVRVGSAEWNAHAQVFDNAHRDAATGLLNGRGLRRAFDAQPSGRLLALLQIRIDDDRAAAAQRAGDDDAPRCALVAHVARVLPDGAVLARVGDLQFAALLVDAAAADVVRVAENLRMSIAADRQAAGSATNAAVSIGIARGRVPAIDLQQLLLAAERALYAARAAGGNRRVGP